MARTEETFSCMATCIAETQRAIKVEIENDEPRWIPKSVVHDDSEVFEKDGTGKLVVFAWWAEKEGLS